MVIYQAYPAPKSDKNTFESAPFPCVRRFWNFKKQRVMSIRFNGQKKTQSSYRPKGFVVGMIYTTPLKSNTLPNKKSKNGETYKNEDNSVHTGDFNALCGSSCALQFYSCVCSRLSEIYLFDRCFAYLSNLKTADHLATGKIPFKAREPVAAFFSKGAKDT
jgi:hypothetical protein